MKKLLLLITLPLFFLSGCWIISNKQTCSTWDIANISLLQEQLSGLIAELSWSQADNTLLRTNLSGLEQICTTWDIEKISQLEAQISGLIMQNYSLQAENTLLKANLPKQNTGTNLARTTTGSRYRKIYSDQYSIYTKNKTTYTICLAENQSVCIDISQHTWNFKTYYKSLMPAADRNNLAASREPTIVSTISWKMQRKCSLYIESQVCFNENLNWILVMIISDQQWVWFNGWAYDPKDILKVIDF